MLSIWCCACSLLRLPGREIAQRRSVPSSLWKSVPGSGCWNSWLVDRQVACVEISSRVLRCFQFKAKSSESELFKPQRSPQQPHSPAIWPNQQIFKLTLIVLISTCSSSAMSMFFLASSSAFFLAAILAAFLSAFFCFLCRRTWWGWLLGWGWRCPGDRVLPCY